MALQHRLDFFGKQVFAQRHQHAVLPSHHAQPALRIQVAQVAHADPVAVTQGGGGVIGTAHIVHEDHGAAHINQAGTVFTLRCADLQLYIVKRPADHGGIGLHIGVHPGNEAGLRGAVELDDAGRRKQCLQRRRALAHPARAAHQDQTHRVYGRAVLVLGGLHHQQQLAGHGYQARRAARAQGVQCGTGRKLFLHLHTATGPQAQQHAKQKQGVRVAPGREYAAAGVCAKGIQTGLKAGGPGAVVAPVALGGAGAARGVADIKGRGGLGRGCVHALCGQRSLHRFAYGPGPVGVAHHGAAAAGDDAQKIHQTVWQCLCGIHQHTGRSPGLAERLGALRQLLLQLRKADAVRATANRHGLAPRFCPVGQGRVNQIDRGVGAHFRARPPNCQSGRPRATV